MKAQPLVHGGREPHRLWGYLRHRRIYQSGVLKDDRHAARQQAIDAEEQQRVRERHRRDRLAAEELRHKDEVAKITARHKAVLAAGQTKTQGEKDEYLRGTRSLIKRENEFHQRRLAEIEREFADQAAMNPA